MPGAVNLVKISLLGGGGVIDPREQSTIVLLNVITLLKCRLNLCNSEPCSEKLLELGSN